MSARTLAAPTSIKTGFPPQAQASRHWERGETREALPAMSGATVGEVDWPLEAMMLVPEGRLLRSPSGT